MLRISPKLISVELNRVGTDDKDRRSNKTYKGTPSSFGSSKPRVYGDFSLGRFPTQLFTNIKNDRYKYVKNITEID